LGWGAWRGYITGEPGRPEVTVGGLRQARPVSRARLREVKWLKKFFPKFFENFFLAHFLPEPIFWKTLGRGFPRKIIF
jgi:hypothetical protein